MKTQLENTFKENLEATSNTALLEITTKYTKEIEDKDKQILSINEQLKVTLPPNSNKKYSLIIRQKIKK